MIIHVSHLNKELYLYHLIRHQMAVKELVNKEFCRHLMPPSPHRGEGIGIIAQLGIVQ